MDINKVKVSQLVDKNKLQEYDESRNKVNLTQTNVKVNVTCLQRGEREVSEGTFD
jgi:hypothetical protein